MKKKAFEFSNYSIVSCICLTPGGGIFKYELLFHTFFFLFIMASDQSTLVQKQRMVIKFLGTELSKPTEIHYWLLCVFGEQTVTHSSVFELCFPLVQRPANRILRCWNIKAHSQVGKMCCSVRGLHRKIIGSFHSSISFH